MNIIYNFENKNVFITGASRGIGKATARLYAKGKASLLLTEVEQNYNALKTFTNELVQEFGIRVYTYVLDITNHTQIKDVVEKAISDVEQIDILVNNAGINQLIRAVHIQEDDWDAILDTNLKGTFFMTKEIGQHMVLNRKGCIISVASQHGVVGNEMRAHYCASKAGIINMSKAIAYEWAGYGVRVNTVSPTFVINESNRDLLSQRDMVKKYLNNIPLKIYAKPEDIANAIAFLSAEEAKMITGTNLLIDGGWTAV